MYAKGWHTHTISPLPANGNQVSPNSTWYSDASDGGACGGGGGSGRSSSFFPICLCFFLWRKGEGVRRTCKQREEEAELFGALLPLAAAILVAASVVVGGWVLCCCCAVGRDE